MTPPTRPDPSLYDPNNPACWTPASMALKQAWNDYVDWLFTTGTPSLLLNNIIDKLHYVNDSDRNIADSLGETLSIYDNHWNVSDREAVKYYPDEFRVGGSWPTIIQIEEWQEFIDPETGHVSIAVPADAPEGETAIGTTSCSYIIDYATGVLATNDLLPLGYDWLPARLKGTNAASGAAYSMLNQGWLFTSGQEGSRDTLITLLSVQPSFLTRLSGVIAVGNRMWQKNLALSQKVDVLHGLRHSLAKIPIDAITNKYVSVNSPYWYHIMGNIPTAEQTVWLLMSNGLEPMGLVSPTNPDIIPAATPEWITGRAKTSQVGLSQSFHDHWNWCFAAAMGCYRALSGEKIPNLSDNISPGVIVNPDGTISFDPSHPRGTLFGALLDSAQYTDANNVVQYAYPQLQDDADWNDLAGAVAAGKCTNLQCWYLVNDGLLIDPVFRSILRDGNTTGTLVSQFQAQPNGIFLYQLAQMKTPPTN